jgi:hypothetical protein
MKRFSYTVSMGLFYGTSANTFSPQATMTRAMFVTVLGRHAGAHGEGSGAGTVAASGVNLRSGPGTDTKILCVLDKNTALPVLGISGDWYQVRYGAYTGYIRRDLMRATAHRSPCPLWMLVQPLCRMGIQQRSSLCNDSGHLLPKPGYHPGRDLCHAVQLCFSFECAAAPHWTGPCSLFVMTPQNRHLSGRGLCDESGR